jgi:hypothetical protein
MFSKVSWAAVLVATSATAFAQQFNSYPSGRDTNRRPNIGASVTGFKFVPESLRLLVDGQDVTPMSSITLHGINWAPTYDLDVSKHRVQLTGQAVNGERIDRSWGFAIAPRPGVGGYNPNANIPYLKLDQKFPTGRQSGAQPDIGAHFQGQLQSIRLLVDGQDFTNRAQQSPNSIVWKPTYQLDAGRHTVLIDAVGIHGRRVQQNWNFQVDGNGNSNIGAAFEITKLWPQPSSIMPSRPKLGADFSENVSNVRLFADGQELTSSSTIHYNSIRWAPHYDLSAGRHNVRVVAQGLSGRQLTKDWTFQVSPKASVLPSNPPNPSWGAVNTITTFPSGDQSGRRPAIGIVVPAGTQVKNYALVIDGRDITSLTHADGGRYYFIPTYDVQPGVHHAEFTGWTGNERLQQSWAFTIR